MTATTSPQHRLAHLLNGEAHQSGAITFGGNVLTVSIGGVVRVNGVQVGMWGDDVEVLAVAAMGVAA